MKLIEAARTIADAIKFVVGLVEEIFVKPKSGEEKKAAAMSILKQWLTILIDQLDIPDWWKKVLKTVVNWDFVLGLLIDKLVAHLNELGVFTHKS